MKQFWDERYRQRDYIYGEEPNEFFRESIKGIKPGRMLLPAEGEGRNAVYAAQKGWEVEAFDFSKSAMDKAHLLARRSNVSITYSLDDYLSFRPLFAPFDVVAMIYAHTDSKTREQFYPSIKNMLKSNGIVLIEAFSKNQIGNSSGGPKDPDMLLSTEELKIAFKDYRIETCEEVEIDLKEGEFHVGKGSVVRMKAVKP